MRFAPESAWSSELRGGEDRWEVAATLGERPFALSRALGAGRLVVFAEGRFLENQWLDRGDAAPLAVDLALALGPPIFDERSHGLVPSRSTLGYLARSPALLCFAGLALLALGFAWYGAAEPPRSRRRAGSRRADSRELRAHPSPASTRRRGTTPASSSATASSRRGACAVTSGCRQDAPLAERLGRRRGLSPAGLARLASDAPVASAAELARAAALLDRLVEEAAR